MRICVLGGTGIISAAVVREAAARGHEVTIVNRGRTGTRPLPDVERVVADVQDADSLAAALAGRRFDALADFLAYVPEQAVARHDLAGRIADRYVFISSASAYAKPVPAIPITEDTPLHNPFWGYSRDKIACEAALAAASGVPVTVVRPSHTYDEASVPLGHWTFVERMRAGQPVYVPGDGTSLWTLTHAADLAVAFVGLLGTPDAAGATVHITSDRALPWDAIYRSLAAAAGVDEPDLVHVPGDLVARWDADLGASLLGDKSHNAVFDNSRIKALVPGWSAPTTWEEGAAAMVAWHDADPARRVRDPEVDAANDALAAFMRRDAGW